MRATIALLLVAFVATASVAQANLQVITQEDSVPSAPLPSNGAAVDEVVVESSLYIKPKPNAAARKARSVPEVEPSYNSLVEHKRVKRISQFRSKLLGAL